SAWKNSLIHCKIIQLLKYAKITTWVFNNEKWYKYFFQNYFGIIKLFWYYNCVHLNGRKL
ncbi:MAG: hypothetical protein LBS23_01880, partial [Holosporaceae bacterium]|nr:hypothetical protein [Holosporaceae bacterium]